MTTNGRTNRARVAIGVFVGILMMANAVAAQDQTLSPTMIPHTPVELPGEFDLVEVGG